MSSSKDPKIFVYNPTCEIAIANGTVSYMPNKMLSQFEKDLDVLPMYFAKEKDIVLVDRIPDQEFIASIQKTGLSIPAFRKFEASLRDKDFISLNKESLEPWGWSPRIHHIFNELKSACSPAFSNRANSNWKKEHKDLYSRKKALEILHTFLDNSRQDKYIDKQDTAKICTSVSHVEELISAWKQIVIKAPWSSSGRGLQVLRQSHLNDSIVQWIKGTLDLQGYLMVEPLLNKQFDFSLQYYIHENGKIDFLGNGFFSTNSNGQYDSNILGGMPEEMQKYLPKKDMQELADGIKEVLGSDLAKNYCGYLGVDCMLFLDQDQKMRIQPCLEINLRYNMGTLALIFDQYLHPESKGVFKVHFQPKSTFDQFHKSMSDKHPFKIKDGKWHEGYLPLVSFTQNRIFGAYLSLESIKKQ
ncbi:hypothetical protein [Marinifilum caeruleilacunae]|uniref:ATP-grasp domain-containing protein n=1 Tax=Marinifilum caeruleilacunae TaxID=2499076 RepID=A0ABX1WR42_9BACT|nr:hypothetical protein [Marinifilum caeruleilacunae]NOU58559.1 hypothetical protein [Marinifilum caeruleilacunae]